MSDGAVCRNATATHGLLIISSTKRNCKLNIKQNFVTKTFEPQNIVFHNLKKNCFSHTI